MKFVTGIYITFGSGKACIRTPEGRTIDLGTRLGQLYVVDVSKPATHALVAQSKQKPVSFETWHRRLGHVGAETMCEMISNALVDGFRVEGDLSINGLCEDCLFGKHTAHPYHENTMRKREVLERVHIDIWGPSPIQSAGGCIYFMVIMNGFSSFRMVAFLRNKSANATLKVFKDYHAEAEQQTGKKLKSIRLNMGREWCNVIWEDYRTTHGLNFEYTTPYAHQQNGAAERTMQTILDGVRSAMAESGLPLKFWADAVQTIVYIQNFIPSSRNPKIIPAEAWFGKRQDISHLRPFGTTAYARVPLDLNISKLSPRSVKTYLLGYFGQEGYKLLDRKTGAVFKSRDVIFEEGITYLAKQPTPTIFSEDNNPFQPIKARNLVVNKEE